MKDRDFTNELKKMRTSAKEEETSDDRKSRISPVFDYEERQKARKKDLESFGNRMSSQILSKVNDNLDLEGRISTRVGEWCDEIDVSLNWGDYNYTHEYGGNEITLSWVHGSGLVKLYTTEKTYCFGKREMGKIRERVIEGLEKDEFHWNKRLSSW